MRFVERTGPGQLGLSYMWLPTFVGMNAALIKEIDDALTPMLVGQTLTEERLDCAHDKVLEILVTKFHMWSGLFEYLDGIKYVEPHAESKAHI